jgi:hypothetical protein
VPVFYLRAQNDPTKAGGAPLVSIPMFYSSGIHKIHSNQKIEIFHS